MAAFFAARRAVELDPRPPALAVWALPAAFLQSEDRLERIGPPPKRTNTAVERLFLARMNLPYRLEIVTVPGATNSYLRAQKGLFTLLEPKPDKPDGVKSDTSFALLPSADDVLLKFTLPSERAAELLQRLACEGISSAAAYPDFRGVVRSLDERRFWNAGSDGSGSAVAASLPGPTAPPNR